MKTVLRAGMRAAKAAKAAKPAKPTTPSKAALEWKPKAKPAAAMKTQRVPRAPAAPTLDTTTLPKVAVVGLGITGSTVLATAVANGWRGIGVELRALPSRSAGFNTREELLHQFAKIDRMMEQRYPGMQTMRLSREIKKVLVPVKRIEDLDARGAKVVRSRTVPPKVGRPNPAVHVSDYDAMLGGNTPWQVSSTDFETVLRKYLAHLEESDLKNGVNPPRVTLHLGARPVVAQGADGKAVSGEALKALPEAERGAWTDSTGVARLSIERVERQANGVTARKAGTSPELLGDLDLVVVTEGSNSATAERLGHRLSEVSYTDLPGFQGQPTAARKRVLSGRLDLPVGPVLRNRVATVYDDAGQAHWVRQQVVGGKKEQGSWVLIEVPPGKTFDPIAEGVVPAGTAPTSPEYRQGAQALTKKFFMQQAALVMDKHPDAVARAAFTNGPNEFTLTERMSKDVVVAKNAVVAGDRVGNGFFGYGGAMTGAISHAEAFNTYFQALSTGANKGAALASLGDELIRGTSAWVRLSKVQFEGPNPALLQGGQAGDRALPTIGALN